MHRRQLQALARAGGHVPRSDEVYHLVIYPIVREGRAIVEPGIQSLLQQTFPPKRLLVVLAVEARAEEAVHADAHELQGRYREQLLDLLVVRHPDDLPGEARVKGANATCAAKAAATYFIEHGIPFGRVIVSCFDADTIVSPEYFACLTHHFLCCPKRSRASFQPIPVYHNNIWNAPGFARVLDIGSSFFQLIEATNPQTLVTFSSHSMSFEALVEVGYWPVDMISDDSAIFWKALLHFDGDYRVVPMYITLSMDIAVADTWRKTAAGVYKQKRRWAWGVENFPLVIRGFLATKRMSWLAKCRHGFKMLEGHVGWATWAFLLTIIGWLPAVFAGREFSSSVLYYSAPRITGTIFQLASLALLTTILLSLLLLPHNPRRSSLRHRLGHALEWLGVPVVAVFWSAMPALDAQTRLMLGRYMEFWVADKQR
jgi:cellulose synthase/poly-beta-1,6-N-acetylglucosamine synthase-like glycosyltransferase